MLFVGALQAVLWFLGPPGVRLGELVICVFGYLLGDVAPGYGLGIRCGVCFVERPCLPLVAKDVGPGRHFGKAHAQYCDVAGLR